MIKNKTAHTVTSLAAASLALMTLAGCVAVDSEPRGGGDVAQAEEKPAKTTAPEPDATKEPETEVDETAEPDATAEPEETDEPIGREEEEIEETNLAAEDGETVYLLAVQGFTPELERWTVDEEMSLLHYTRYSCIGSVQEEVYASLVASEDVRATTGGDLYTATWEGSNPMLAESRTTDFEITDRTLVRKNGLADEVASVHLESVVAEFSGMCRDSRNAVANFVV